VDQCCAHGFQTLEDESAIFYRMSACCDAALAWGVRWDDPAFRIGWPGAVAVISERDRTNTNWEGDTVEREIMACLWVLNLSDGEHTLLDIAERSGLPFSVISDAAELLCQNGLLV
jgi:hypothetical protein